MVIAGVDDDAEAALDELDDPDLVADVAQVFLVPRVLVDQGRHAFPEFRFVIQILERSSSRFNNCFCVVEGPGLQLSLPVDRIFHVKSSQVFIQLLSVHN